MSLPSSAVVTPGYNDEETILESIDVSGSSPILTDARRRRQCELGSDGAIVDEIAHTEPRVRSIRESFFVDANENLNRAFARTDPDSGYCTMVLW